MQLVASLCYFSPFISFLICIHRPFDLWKRASKCDLLARGIARPLYRAAIVTWWCWLFFVIMISIGQIITILGLFNTFVLLYRQSNSSKKCIPTFIIDKKKLVVAHSVINLWKCDYMTHNLSGCYLVSNKSCSTTLKKALHTFLLWLHLTCVSTSSRL